MKFSIYFFLFLLSCLRVNSQKQDSIIFTTQFEKQVFSTYIKTEEVSSFDLLLAMNYESQSTQIKSSLNLFIKSLELKGLDKYPRKKQIKEIYKLVHDRFFKKYTEETYFSDIFKNGNYNCVTASALYALVLDHFKIEYIIKETPNHVYIIADPNSTSFLIETTLPSKGVYQFDDRFKKNYVDFLVSNKIISQSEYKTNSINDLFEKNYESAKTISLLQLGALQYYNRGVFAFNAANYPLSSSNFEKASIIYPSNNVKYLFSNSLLLMLTDQSTRKKFDGKTLAKYANTNKTNTEAIQQSKDHFKAIGSEMVINHPDIKGFKIVYTDLCAFLNDSIDKSDFTQTYHDLLAYYYYTKNDFGEVIKHAKASYQVNPDNIQTQQFLKEALLKYLSVNYTTEMPPSDSMIYYAEKYPFMLGENAFLNMLAGSYGNDLLKNSNSKNEKEVSELHKRFRTFIRRQSGNGMEKDFIEGFYSETSSMFVKIAEYEIAESILQEGLLFVPESWILKQKLQTIKTSKKDLQKYMNSTKTYVKYKAPEPVKPPKFDAATVNANVKKYLPKCWSLNMEGKSNPKGNKKDDELKFIFFTDNKVKFKSGTEEHWGTYKFNQSNSTLELESNEDKEKFAILIYEASEMQMKGIMSVDSDGMKVELNGCEK